MIAADGVDAAVLLGNAAPLQAGSQHPLAAAVRAKAGDVPPAAVNDFRDHPGRGIGGRIGDRALLFGNGRLLDEAGIEDRKSTRLNSSPSCAARMPSSSWKTEP